VHEAIADPELHPLIAHLMSAELAPTLEPTSGLDPAAYQRALLARFANPALRHRLRQIAMDGSQKLPQRLLPPLLQRLRRGQSVAALTLALAAWMRFVAGCDEQGNSYLVDDPQHQRIAAVVKECLPAGTGATPEVRQIDGATLAAGLLGIEEVFGAELPQLPAIRQQLGQQLSRLLQTGARATLRHTLNNLYCN
jgi:fructuronate reductase